jgi:hypothetical protein
MSRTRVRGSFRVRVRVRVMVRVRAVVKPLDEYIVATSVYSCDG